MSSGIPVLRQQRAAGAEEALADAGAWVLTLAPKGAKEYLIQYIYMVRRLAFPALQRVGGDQERTPEPRS